MSTDPKLTRPIIIQRIDGHLLHAEIPVTQHPSLAPHGMKPDNRESVTQADEIAALRAENAELREILSGILHFEDGFVGRSIIGDALMQWREAARSALEKGETP